MNVAMKTWTKKARQAIHYILISVSDSMTSHVQVS